MKSQMWLKTKSIIHNSISALKAVMDKLKNATNNDIKAI
jgi:hypothetical protein